MFQECFENIIFSTDYLAETVTYAGSDVKAVPEYKEDTNEDSGKVENILILFLMTSEVTRPAYMDSVIVTMPDESDKTWYVHEILDGNQFYWKVLCKEEERPKL